LPPVFPPGSVPCRSEPFAPRARIPRDTCSPTWSGIGFGKHPTFDPPLVGSSSHLRRILLPERSNLLKSHWSNQWLTKFSYCADQGAWPSESGTVYCRSLARCHSRPPGGSLSHRRDDALHPRGCDCHSLDSRGTRVHRPHHPERAARAQTEVKDYTRSTTFNSALSDVSVEYILPFGSRQCVSSVKVSL